MTNKAAIRWLTRGKNKPPVIQYMLINSKLEYLISPREVEVNDLKKNLKEIFENIEKFSSNTALEVYYKSINKHYGKHRKDSAQFHHLVKKILTKKRLLKFNSRMAFFLKKDNLRLFKDALYLLDIDCKSRGCAFIAYLWMIALKATRSRIPLVIKQLWKSRFSINRMNKNDQARFAEFYAHFI